MASRDDARAAKNKFSASLDGNLYENGIGGIGISGDKTGDWHVRVILMSRGGTTDVPEEVDGVKFVKMYVPKVRALRDRERDS